MKGKNMNKYKKIIKVVSIADPNLKKRVEDLELTNATEEEKAELTESIYKSHIKGLNFIYVILILEF